MARCQKHGTRCSVDLLLLWGWREPKGPPHMRSGMSSGEGEGAKWGSRLEVLGDDACRLGGSGRQGGAVVL